MVILEQSLTDHNQIIGRDADRCVLCGLCLPHCPTYQLAKDEGESPRGRISLMLGLSRGQLALTPTLVAHFDHCLGCRACENVCPSGVPYGRLIDRVQNLIVDRQPRKQLWFRLLSAMARQRRPGRSRQPGRHAARHCSRKCRVMFARTWKNSRQPCRSRNMFRT